MENKTIKSNDIVFKEIEKQLIKFFYDNGLKTYMSYKAHRILVFGTQKSTSFLYRLLHPLHPCSDEFGTLFLFSIKEKNIELKSFKKEFTELVNKLNLNIFGEPYSVTIIEDFDD